MKTMEDSEFEVGVAKTMSNEKELCQKQTESGKLWQVQKNWLEARKKIASLEAQINMHILLQFSHRLREESLVCEMVDLRRNQEINQAKFDEERREWLRDIREFQRNKLQNSDIGNVEIAKLKAEIAELKSSLDDAERTRMFLLEDNGKIKQQKAKLRCDYNTLKREHSKLLLSHQSGAASMKREILCDRNGAGNSMSYCSENRSECRVNFGSAVLGLSETCNICIPAVTSTEFTVSNNQNVKSTSDCNTNSTVRSLDTQVLLYYYSGCSLWLFCVVELTEKLKRASERNSDLQKALRIVDAQCEKLVRSFQELKLRYKTKKSDRLLKSRSEINIIPPACSSSERSDTDLGHSTLERNCMLLYRNFQDNGSDASDAVKRSYTPCLSTVRKRPRNDLC
ncbi:unnamed protein product [Thelazia callipaeda]|uniref:Coiled-coil domain-containing protein 62 n=1 Tax=Thelazia callipaeda TaxID=103827 RepID=A0A158RBD3_THECL|nr:unnamed protein product [Thelazia callipaeda]